MLNAPLLLKPCPRMAGSVTPPGSKSISNRVLPLAALAAGETRIRNLLSSEDVAHMLHALALLGCRFDGEDPTEIRMEGRKTGGEAARESLEKTAEGRGRNAGDAQEGLPAGWRVEKPLDLFLGNSGTSTRILTALLSASQGTFTVDGIARMRERPIGDLVDALRPLGPRTVLAYLGNPGFPPLKIEARGLEGGRTTIKGDVSSQFLTGLLMALPLCGKAAEVRVTGRLVSRPYVDLTLALMRSFGAEVLEPEENLFRLEEPMGYRSPGSYLVEPDASSASYFLAAGAVGGGPVTVRGLGKDSLQGEAGFARMLERMGAKVEIGADSITVAGAPLRGIDADMDAMVDTGMTLAVAALFAEGPTTIRNVGNWRVKETDRLRAMAAELRKLGAAVTEGEDFLAVDPPEKIRSATIETYDDHRIAMCFSLACLGGAEVTLLDPGCTAKTYPRYFEDFASLRRDGSGAAA